jgi:hypothetical protein
MVKVISGIKILNIKNVKKQEGEKLYAFVKGFLEDDHSGSMVIEINENNPQEIIANISTKKAIDHDKLEDELLPVLEKKNIKSLELFRFNTEIAFVKGKDRVVISEMRKIDLDDFSYYRDKNQVSIEDVFYTLLTLPPLEG